jgi:hypothetical protein
MNKKSCVRPQTACRVAVALMVTCGAFALPALADDSARVSKNRLSLEERIDAGDLKYRDPQTGEIVVATAERVAAIRNGLAPNFDWPSGAEISVADDGTVRADIGGAMRDVFVVRANLDGSRQRGCFRDLDAAVAFIVGLDADEAKRAGNRTPVAVTE